MTKPAAEQFADALMDRIERETRHAPRGLLKSWIVEEYMRLHPHACVPHDGVKALHTVILADVMAACDALKRNMHA